MSFGLNGKNPSVQSVWNQLFHSSLLDMNHLELMEYVPKLIIRPYLRKIIKFRQDLANSSLLSDSSDHADLDALVGAFDDTLSHLVDCHAPLKTRTITIRPHSPWYTDEIATEKRKRRSLERR